MRLSGPFSPVGVRHVRVGALTLVAFTAWFAPAQPGMTRKGDKWERQIYGTLPAPAGMKLRINAHGSVTLSGGISSRTLTYTALVSVAARTESEARRALQQYAVRVDPQGDWMVLTTPGGAALAELSVKAPRLRSVVISTSSGDVEATSVDGPLSVDSGAGELRADRIRGDCKLITGGGPIRVGQVGGSLRCATGAGPITVKSVSGEAVLETDGGDIQANEAGGAVHANTGGGGVHIIRAGGLVTATSGGGEIIVDKANGTVTARNLAGPVQVGAASGVRCESASGGVRLSNISGSMRVSTSLGSILANLLNSRLADSTLATADGDITVLIPSNVGVTILAQNSMADTLRRIMSDFPGIQPKRQGTRLVAEGPVNGGGPLLQISGMGGTIFIKRQ